MEKDASESRTVCEKGIYNNYFSFNWKGTHFMQFEDVNSNNINKTR